MKIGIFGGTFNPPHNGHISAALKFKERLKLDKILFIPTFIPPHKDTSGADAEKRLEMTRLSIKDIKGFEASDIDIKRGGKSYAILTIYDLQRLYPGAQLYFLCGSDMFVTLHTWYKAFDIFKNCSVAGAARNNGEYGILKEYAEKIRAEYNADAYIIRIKPFVISSSEIREKVFNGDDISAFVNADVMNYIEKNGLYRDR